MPAAQQKMSAMKLALVVSIFRLVPHLLAFRDWYFFIPSHPSQGHGLNTQGFVHVEHTPDVMKRVMQQEGGGSALSQKKSEKEQLELYYRLSSFKMYYETTVAEDLSLSGEDNSLSIKNQDRTKEHIVLIHGTALSTEFWFCENKTNLVDMFVSAGYDITLVDLRGHGQSEKPTGPYTIPLLAADVAAALKLIHPNLNQNFHVYGLSVGFGVAMKLALDYPDMCKTLSGSGFLFDKSQKDVAAYIFSRRIVVKMFGVALLSKIGEWVLGVNDPGMTSRAWRHTTIEGYIHTASAWLKFNVTDQLSNHMVPTLIMVPEKDALIGHTYEAHYQEASLMPKGVADIVEFAGYSHVMCCEEGGAKKQFEAFQAFVSARSLSTCAA